MFILLALLPFALAMLFWRKRIGNWRDTFIVAAVLWGAYAIVLTELLSRFNAIDRPCVAVGWAIASVLVVAIAKLLKPLGGTPPQISEPIPGESWVLLPQILLIGIALAIIGWVGPPNNWDSMVYHMARVVNWVQNRNVAFFPCSSPRQLEMPPGAEYLILQFQILSQTDRWANLVQWFAYVGCVVGVSSGAMLLGAGKRGQILAAVVMATMPMACLQAESTQNDLVGALWFVCFVVLVLRICYAARTAAGAWLFILAGLALGLALITKTTQYIFAAPFCLGLAIVALRRMKMRALAPLAALAVIAISLSIPTYVRNYRFTHTLLGEGGFGPAGGDYTNAHLGIAPAASNIIRNLAVELCTPPRPLQADLGGAVATIHHALHLEVNDPDTNFGGTFDLTYVPWYSEDQAPSPAHTLLAGAAIVSLVMALRRGSRTALFYAIAIVAGFLAFSAYLRWQPWHCRLLLPLLAASSVFTGVAMEKYWKTWVSIPIAALLPLLVTPFIVANQTHPLAGDNSIMDLTREQRFFYTRKLYPQYVQIAEFARIHHVRQVACIGDGNCWLYPLQAMVRDRIPGVVVVACRGVGTWPAEILHTRNQGFDPNLKPFLVVDLRDDKPVAVDLEN